MVRAIWRRWPECLAAPAVIPLDLAA